MTSAHDAMKIREALMPVLNGLNKREGLLVDDINAVMFGLVTCSMGQTMGPDQARDWIESAMNNVWGPKPKPRRWWHDLK